MDEQDSGNRLRLIMTLQVITLVVVAASFWLAVSTYPALPHTMATHFNATGQPDRWVTKSWGRVLLLPIIELVVFLLMAGMTFWIESSPGSLAYVNLPINKEALSDDQKDRLRFLSAQGMSVISICVLGLLTYVNYTVMHANLSGRGPHAATIMIPIIGIVALIFVTVLWLILATRSISHQ